jgi:hypothetical protein
MNKWPGREADHSPRSSAEVKNAWRYTSTPSLRLHLKHKDAFAFTCTFERYNVCISFETCFIQLEKHPEQNFCNSNSHMQASERHNISFNTLTPIYKGTGFCTQTTEFQTRETS